MPEEQPLVDPAKIEAKIVTLQSQISLLRKLLRCHSEMSRLQNSVQSDSLDDPATDYPRSNLVYTRLKGFILSQTDIFSSTLLKTVAGTVENHIYHAAIRRLINDGTLEVVEQPIGRKAGVYRRKEGQ